MTAATVRWGTWAYHHILLHWKLWASNSTSKGQFDTASVSIVDNCISDPMLIGDKHNACTHCPLRRRNRAARTSLQTYVCFKCPPFVMPQIKGIQQCINILFTSTWMLINKSCSQSTLISRKKRLKRILLHCSWSPLAISARATVQLPTVNRGVRVILLSFSLWRNHVASGNPISLVEQSVNAIYPVSHLIKWFRTYYCVWKFAFFF